MSDITGDDSGICMMLHGALVLLWIWASYPAEKCKKMIPKWKMLSFFILFFNIHCTFSKRSHYVPLQGNDVLLHICIFTPCVCCILSLAYSLGCVCSCVCVRQPGSPCASESMKLCDFFFLVAFATLFSRGVCHVWLKLTLWGDCCLPLLPSTPFLSLLLLSPFFSTLLSLNPSSPSSRRSDSTGECAPSRSHPPLPAPMGGVSLETVSELTGWVQIDGCPLSDYTTGPLKATQGCVCPHGHPWVLSLNGPFHLTLVNITSTQAEGVFVCV